MTTNVSGQWPGALGGIRVLDFTAFVAGPYCTRLMADLGAEVVKVEPPAGDLLRATSPLLDGHSRFFGQLNCGKKSLQLDLKTAEGGDLARQLAAKADVVVENFRPGVMARFGLDYPTLSAAKPDLIYGSISGYGQTGPGAERPAFAAIVHAASGYDLAQLDYQDGNGAPARGRPVVADILAGTHANAAISAALHHRGRTGIGQYLDIALIDAMHNVLPYEFQASQLEAQVRRVPIYEPIRTQDGFIIITPVTQKNFESLAKSLDRPEWITDPRFKERGDRLQNWPQLVAMVGDWAAGRTAAECERIIGRGCPCARYQTIGESLATPEVVARGGAVEAEDAAGRFMVPAPPLRMSASAAPIRPKVPELGEHDGEVIRNWLAGDAEE
jgi:crotonobetainyl-CoA:carnitine CoA-transferase CaiB-like acyl-CoA transferase